MTDQLIGDSSCYHLGLVYLTPVDADVIVGDRQHEGSEKLTLTGKIEGSLWCSEMLGCCDDSVPSAGLLLGRGLSCFTVNHSAVTRLQLENGIQNVASVLWWLMFYIDDCRLQQRLLRDFPLMVQTVSSGVGLGHMVPP